MKKRNTMELLPIGSVVLLKEAEKRVMIVGVYQTDSESKVEYDYLGVLYPEGSIGDKMRFLFDHKDIGRIDFVGYNDKERVEFLQRLQDYFDQQEK